MAPSCQFYSAKVTKKFRMNVMSPLKISSPIQNIVNPLVGFLNGLVK